MPVGSTHRWAFLHAYQTLESHNISSGHYHAGLLPAMLCSPTLAPQVSQWYSPCLLNNIVKNLILEHLS
jgi:hypothetical protein